MGAKKTKAPAEAKANGSAGNSDRKLTRATLIELYAARRYLGLAALKETGLRLPIEVYFKDPAVASASEGAGFDTEFTAPWEPGLRDGPTSARFAVVDYDATSNTLTPLRSGTASVTAIERSTAPYLTAKQRIASSIISSASGQSCKILLSFLRAALRSVAGSAGHLKVIG
ncbi:hypothetical protein ACVWZ6_002320 [Bradyrhizobium sp. GM6.1]